MGGLKLPGLGGKLGLPSLGLPKLAPPKPGFGLGIDFGGLDLPKLGFGLPALPKLPGVNFGSLAAPGGKFNLPALLRGTKFPRLPNGKIDFAGAFPNGMIDMSLFGGSGKVPLGKLGFDLPSLVGKLKVPQLGGIDFGGLAKLPGMGLNALGGGLNALGKLPGMGLNALGNVKLPGLSVPKLNVPKVPSVKGPGLIGGLVNAGVGAVNGAGNLGVGAINGAGNLGVGAINGLGKGLGKLGGLFGSETALSTDDLESFLQEYEHPEDDTEMSLSDLLKILN